MFVEPIKRITINDKIAEWLMVDIKKYHKNTLELQEDRYNILKNNMIR